MGGECLGPRVQPLSYLLAETELESGGKPGKGNGEFLPSFLSWEEGPLFLQDLG